MELKELQQIYINELNMAKSCLEEAGRNLSLTSEEIGKRPFYDKNLWLSRFGNYKAKVERYEAVLISLRKAEKYDKVLEQKEHYKTMVKKAVKENPLREPYDELLNENQILKEGIKTIMKHYDIGLHPIRIEYKKGGYMVDIPQEDTAKIKTMLKIIDKE